MLIEQLKTNTNPDDEQRIINNNSTSSDSNNNNSQIHKNTDKRGLSKENLASQPLAEAQETSTNSDQLKVPEYNWPLRWLVHEPIYTRPWLRSGQWTEFFKGFEFVTRGLWPLSLTGLLAYDIYKFYYYPNERYGDTLEKIFLGMSTNHDTWSSNLGGDLPTDYRNWLGISLILLSPWVAGGLWSRISNYHNRWDKSFNVQDIEKLYDENDVEAPLLLSSSIVVAFKNKSTAYLEHLILWNNKIDLEIKKIALEEIINRANGHILVQPAALSALANIVLYENSYQLNQYALSQKALNTIQEIATDQVRIKKLLGSTYANYLDWSLGYKSKWRHLFFMPFHLITSSAVWYTTGHYLEVFGIKVVNAIQLLINKYNCENQGKNFRYIDPFAEYVCSLCGDWPVYLGGIDTSQDCLYGLTNQSVPIETLTSRITDRLTGQYADYCEDFADSIWEVASQKYAASAKGDVYVFSNGANPERIYTKIELPILKSNPNVSSINNLDHPYLDSEYVPQMSMSR